MHGTRMLGRFFALLALLLAVLALSPPAAAQDILTLHALTARTAPGTGSAVDVGLSRNLLLVARVTAGSGTVTTFDVWTECTLDGTNWSECAIDDRVEATTTGAGPHTDNVIKLIAETAVTSSGVYAARVTSLTRQIRARWNIAGTTPSETFELLLLPK
jgi:hypothetical protein